MEKFRPKDKIERPAEGYDYFFDKNSRHDIYEICKGLSEYAHEQGVENMVFLDRSARPAWIGVNEYWNAHYDKDTKPGFYFVNPEAFDPENERYDDEHMQETSGLVVVSGGKTKSVESIRRVESDIIERFKKRFSGLVEQREKPVMIFDTCSHTGDTIKGVTSIFKKAGFNDIRISTASFPDRDSGIKADISMGDKLNYNICRHFGVSSAVQDSGDLTSVRNSKAHNARVIRSEIKRIIKEHGE